MRKGKMMSNHFKNMSHRIGFTCIILEFKQTSKYQMVLKSSVS